MASHNQYLSNPNSSFFSLEDDDVDDDTFLANSRQAQSQKWKELEERAIKSSQASVSILRETEEIGIKTAEELMIQREQLERTEHRLDDINTTLRSSQKHIQGIKSVFGSLKNYLSGRNDIQPSQSGSASKNNAVTSSDEQRLSSASRKLTAAVESKPQSSSVHPGLRIRGLSDEQEEEPQVQVSEVHPGSRFDRVNNILDKNIEEVGSSLSRLKGLAEGLGEELESQNELLGRIYDKTDRAETTVQRQNREMNRILKK